MVNTSRIQNLLDNVRFILMIDKPAIVRDLKFYIDFRDHLINGVNIREGVISTYIETDTHYRHKDLYGYVSSYGGTKTIEQADREIVTDMFIIWDTMIDREEYQDFWDNIDFNSEDWKRKEE